MEDKKITAEELLSSLDLDIRDMAQKVANAMNNARDGSIIADSQEPVRDANADFRQKMYQKAIEILQQKQGSFSPCGEQSPDKVGK